MTITEYAEVHGLSERTVRRRIQRGQLKATLTAGPYGPEYQIVEGDRTDADEPPLTRRTPSPDTDEGDSLDGWVGSPDSGLGELVLLVRDLNQQVLELAGRCGFYQARIQTLEEQVKLLSAPAENTARAVFSESQAPAAYVSENASRDAFNDHPPAETSQPTPPAQSGQDSASERPLRPWWRRLGAWLREPV